MVESVINASPSYFDSAEPTGVRMVRCGANPWRWHLILCLCPAAEKLKIICFP